MPWTSGTVTGVVAFLLIKPDGISTLTCSFSLYEFLLLALVAYPGLLVRRCPCEQFIIHFHHFTMGSVIALSLKMGLAIGGVASTMVNPSIIGLAVLNCSHGR